MPTLDELNDQKRALDRNIALATLEPLRTARAALASNVPPDLAAHLDTAARSLVTISPGASAALSNVVLAFRNARATLDRVILAAEHASAEPVIEEPAEQ